MSNLENKTNENITPTLVVDVKKTLGKIKPLHGVNNGPLVLGGYGDLSKYYADMGIPIIRLHDTEFPYPQQVDIPQIFRDFNADPSDPANYDFVLTDQYIAAIQALGCDVIYRLGTSIEHMKDKRFIYPPTDYEKWADICAHIIDHYNNGWANGFHYGITYWEIWNEPEEYNGKRRLMWLGSIEDYHRLYETTSKHLKNKFGDTIKVGGYAAVGLYALKHPEDDYYQYHMSYYLRFIDMVEKTKSPFDFFSFHYYGSHPEDIMLYANYARESLDSKGFTKTEILLDEWNSSFGTPQKFMDMMNMNGAFFVSKAFLAMQHSPIDAATYYDGQSTSAWCGIFSRERIPQKPYFAFRMFNRLYTLNTEAAVSSNCEQLKAFAATDGNSHGVMILNEGETVELRFELLGSDSNKMKLYLLNENTDELLLAEGSFSMFRLPANSIAYIKIE